MEENLYIKIENGQAVSHPSVESNLRLFFPDISPTNIPEGFARFVKQPMPELTENQMIDTITYELSNYYTDLYETPTYVEYYHLKDIREVGQDEIIQRYKEMNPLEADWVFDQATQKLVPPIAKPDDGKEYVWMYPNLTVGENQGKWVDASTVRPMQGSEEDFAPMFAAMRELGLDINSSNMADIPPEIIEELIASIKASTVAQPEEPQGQ